MIKGCEERALVLLDDQRAYQWDTASQTGLKLKDKSEILMFNVNSYTGEYVMLTVDRRVIVGSTIDDKLDITSMLNDCIKGCTSRINDLHLMGKYVFVVSGKHVCILLLGDNKASIVFTHKFKYCINLSTICYHGFLIQTDNRDLWVAALNLLVNWNLIKIELVNTADRSLVLSTPAQPVVKIAYNKTCVFLIMADGSVRGRSSQRDWTNQGYFDLIEFPEATVVTKIIAFDDYVFCITSEGICWFINCKDLLTDTRELNTKPSIKRVPVDSFIEDMYDLRGYAVIQCVRKLYEFVLSSGQMRVTHTPFFDDKDVVDIVQIGIVIYFTTAEGLVYYQWTGDRTKLYTLVPFFENNRVAVMGPAAGIRSTRSTLNDHKF